MKLLDIMTAPWAITSKALAEIQTIYSTHMKGERIDLKALEERCGLPFQHSASVGYETQKDIAVFELSGPLTPELDFFSFLFGGSSTKQFIEALARAKADDGITRGIVKICSPGGLVEGMFEAAKATFEFNEEKPLDFICDGMATSAAYLIASQGRKIYITSYAVQAGNIGSIINHKEFSKMMEDEGITFTEIASGDHKGMGSPFRAMTPEEKQLYKEDALYIANMFFDAVSNSRGLTVDSLQKLEGRTLRGEKAMEAGLVDDVSTFEELVALNPAGSAGIKKGQRASGSDVKMTLKTEKKGMEEIVMTKDELKVDHSALHKEIVAEARQGYLLETDMEAKVSEGIKAETDRITALDALVKPGREKLIAEFKADGKTTAAEASLQILAFEDEKLKGIKMAHEDDAADLSAIKQVETEDEAGTMAEKADAAITAHMEAHKCDYRAALSAVSKLQPELFKDRTGGVKS